MPDTAPSLAPEVDPKPALASVPLLDRERSMLEFNRRVLAQARRPDVPLLERLRYICIVSSNMDEFFEVRFADVLEAFKAPGSTIPEAQVDTIAADAHVLIDEQYRVLNDEVMPALMHQGIVVLNHADRTPAQRRFVDQFFQTQVRPLLAPVSLDPAHPFPQVANKSLNFIVKLDGVDAFGRPNQIAIVKVPRVLPRVIRLPDALGTRGQQVFVLLTSVIRAHLAELFPGREVLVFSQFRVTRDSDLEVDEDEVTNLRSALRSGLTRRHFGRAIRLEVVGTCPSELSDFLLEQYDMPEEALYRVNGPVNLVRLNQLVDQATDLPRSRASAASPRSLRFARHEPAWAAPDLPPGASVLATIARRDVLLHHPFQSFEPVLRFLREAVEDPDVLAIKQTVYRTGSESPMMDLLIEAARRGKEVMCVVELKARFDEEANINWADRLEAVGVQVVYGIVGLKTHAKLLLVTRREATSSGTRLKRYLHLSTGNYNPRTARVYTDLGLLSADPDLTADADAVFQQLASQTRTQPLKRLLQAPFTLHAQMLALIERVAASARRGGPARIVVKCNALTDAALIQALIAAGQAGAQIDLIVRGACCLPAGVAGYTERVRVRSIVGRFLEHTRITYFRWGPREADEALYLSSADWMSRNMLRRIELAWPLRDAAMRQRVIDECLVPYLHDRLDAWRLQRDGRYERVASEGPSAQQALMALHVGGAAPAES
jgi:polyphosphate kinase